jgi:transmembrane sensor
MKGDAMEDETQDGVQARAIGWHIRLRDGNDAAWAAFADWLGEDPRHGEAYDLVERTDLAVDALLPDIVFRTAANDVDGADVPADGARHRRRWLFGGGGALAASVAAALIVGPQFAPTRYEVATGPGEHRIVMLDPTTRVALNGGTRMIFDREDPRFAELASGEALFEVRHDPARPFRLTVGDNRVEDVGTVFDVVHDREGVRVAVAEGEVCYNPGGDDVSLRAGQALADPAAGGTIRVGSAAAGSVGGWQTGQLVYAGEPMARVAADLGRSLGIRIIVADAIADRPFSGTIALDGTGPAQLDRLMPALDVVFVAGQDGWTMKPARSASR